MNRIKRVCCFCFSDAFLASGDLLFYEVFIAAGANCREAVLVLYHMQIKYILVLRDRLEYAESGEFKNKLTQKHISEGKCAFSMPSRNLLNLKVQSSKLPLDQTFIFM